jgi:hypothetical protein
LLLQVSNHRFLAVSKASFTGKKIALGKTEVGTLILETPRGLVNGVTLAAHTYSSIVHG